MADWQTHQRTRSERRTRRHTGTYPPVKLAGLPALRDGETWPEYWHRYLGQPHPCKLCPDKHHLRP